MKYELTARFIALVCFILCALLLVLPWAYTPTYGVPADTDVQFMTRRAAPLFLVPAGVLWVVATEPHSPLRDRLTLWVMAAFMGTAATGLVAFAQGVASWTILVAAVLECAMAAVLWVTRKN